MYKELKKAIKYEHEVILSLIDGSQITGIPRWGEDRSRVKIQSQEKSVWVPLYEIEHVTTIIPLK